MAQQAKKPVKRRPQQSHEDEMRQKKAMAKKRAEAKKREKKQRGKILLFIVEIFVW